jgi:hypothetical protein
MKKKLVESIREAGKIHGGELESTFFTSPVP